MAVQLWQSYAQMRIPSCAHQGVWPKIASGNGFSSSCAKFSSLRSPSTNHSRPSDQLCLRRLVSCKVVPGERSKIRWRMFVRCNDMMETESQCCGIQECEAAEECAVGAVQEVPIVRVASRGYRISCGFGNGIFGRSHQGPFLVLAFRIAGYDADTIRTLALPQRFQRLPFRRSVDSLIQLALGAMSDVCLCFEKNKNSSAKGLAPLQAGPLTLICFFLEFLALPVVLPIVCGIGLLGSVLVIPIVIGALCVVISSLFALLPGIFWLSRVLWEFSFKKTTVVKFQVGLMGRIDTLELELKQLLNVFEGPQQVLTDSVVALLRYSDSYIAADYSLYTHNNIEAIEEKFMYYSLEERGMRDESLEFSSVGSSYSSRSQSVSEDYRLSHLVVTLVVVAKGIRKLPDMKDTKDVEESLKRLGCIQADALQNVGVYCTPFSDQFKMAIKYPKLRYY